MAAEDSIALPPGRLDPWYVTGLCDGEGFFMLCHRFSGGTRQVMPGGAFGINLRADDKGILERVRDFFGCGRFNFSKRPINLDGSRSRPQWHFKIYRAQDLLAKVVGHFRAYPLQAKKHRDFLIWEQGVILLHRVRMRKVVLAFPRPGTLPKWTASEVEEFMALRAALRAQRAYDSSPVILPPPRPVRPEQRSLFDDDGPAF